MCWNSRVRIFRFNSKTQWQMFLLLYGRHVCASMGSTMFFKFGWYTSSNNARIKSSRDLILGEVVYISIMSHIPDFWLDLLNGHDFKFLSHERWKPRILTEFYILSFWKTRAKLQNFKPPHEFRARFEIIGPRAHLHIYGDFIFPQEREIMWNKNIFLQVVS